jgi:hypothetical protein
MARTTGAHSRHFRQGKHQKGIMGGYGDMKSIKIFICTSLLLVLAGVPGYAVDKSICSNGSDVIVNDNGTLQSCTLQDDYEANGITCKHDYQIIFYKSGNLQSCILSELTTIGDISCKEDWPITFYQNGHLNQCTRDSD